VAKGFSSRSTAPLSLSYTIPINFPTYLSAMHLYLLPLIPLIHCQIYPAGVSSSLTFTPTDNTALQAWSEDITTVAHLVETIPADFIGAIIWQESQGAQVYADTEVGLMQIDTIQQTFMKARFPHLYSNITSQYTLNILSGALYMKTTCMNTKFNTWALALRCYNSGPNGKS